MTALFRDTDFPVVAALACARKRPGNVSPAMPAKPDLSVLRLLTQRTPSASRALKCVKACRWACSVRLQPFIRDPSNKSAIVDAIRILVLNSLCNAKKQATSITLACATGYD